MARSSDSFFLIGLFKDKTFQAQEVRRVMYLSLVYLALTTVLLAVFYNHFLGEMISGQAPMLFVSEDVDLLNEQVPAMSSVVGNWMLVMLGINIVVTAILGVYIVRKLGHPIMAIKRALRDIGNGKLDTKLRESDSEEFAEIAEAFNGALSKINEKISEAKSKLEHLEDQPDKESLQASVNSCSQALEYFQTVEVKLDDDSSSRAS